MRFSPKLKKGKSSQKLEFLQIERATPGISKNREFLLGSWIVGYNNCMFIEGVFLVPILGFQKFVATHTFEGPFVFQFLKLLKAELACWDQVPLGSK